MALHLPPHRKGISPSSIMRMVRSGWRHGPPLLRETENFSITLALKAPAPRLANTSIKEEIPSPKQFRDSTIVRAVNADYNRIKGVRRVFLGRQYRDLWATPIRVPLLDLYADYGGLIPDQARRTIAIDNAAPPGRRWQNVYDSFHR